ncbi:polysaccharide deacetylase family protein [Simiduia curdlanivorans]|uniref:Polysaccharide deacetylase family protein n=1 Tax=Simiduia curdlanivorans TaxID=1492769 RepID=A0ABV8V222_9GAMM|nr:polysaccharide deacetylase family protein [Simiduia curdlanivorans]MDN3639985.1 polysaccharide deacetylase family protein [Simiduia curdlanivorans]
MNILKVYIPDYSVSELRYSLDILLGEFLGLTFQAEVTASESITITQSGSEKELILDSSFFQKAFSAWLKPQSMPQLPLQYWTPSENDIVATLVEPSLPVLYGKPGIIKTDKSLTLNVDIFGTAFFMLSRYEELITTDRDQHQRFPATASVAFKENFLERPIVNEYLEVLWSCLKQLWPELQRKNRTANNYISCDVDFPFNPAYYSFNKMFRACARHVVKERSPVAAVKTITKYFASKMGFSIHDEFRENISWIMGQNEEADNKVSFYFIPLVTSHLDNVEDFSSSKMRKVIDEIVSRGHYIGIHPGYDTHNNASNFRESSEFFEKILDRYNINQKEIGGRQHYLRWAPALTATLWEQNNFHYDSSLTYADKTGFRCGCCYEYCMYDLTLRQRLRLKQKPLICMEVTLLDSKYENLKSKPSELLSKTMNLKDRCHKFGGCFGLLWHNSNLDCIEKKLYKKLIR